MKNVLFYNHWLALSECLVTQIQYYSNTLYNCPKHAIICAKMKHVNIANNVKQSRPELLK